MQCADVVPLDAAFILSPHMVASSLPVRCLVDISSEPLRLQIPIPGSTLEASETRRCICLCERCCSRRQCTCRMLRPEEVRGEIYYDSIKTNIPPWSILQPQRRACRLDGSGQAFLEEYQNAKCQTRRFDEINSIVHGRAWHVAFQLFATNHRSPQQSASHRFAIDLPVQMNRPRSLPSSSYRQ